MKQSKDYIGEEFNVNKVKSTVGAVAAEKVKTASARAKTSDKTWTVKAVEEHFREAILTLKKLPPVRQRGYFNYWPDVVHTPNERIFQEPKPMRILATSEAISRLEQSFEWMTWLTVEERKLIWKRAARVKWKTLCWELGYSRATVWKRWQLACSKLARILNAKGKYNNIKNNKIN